MASPAASDFAETTKDEARERRVIFGRNLQAARREAKLTQVATAKIAGVSQNFVSELENGVANPTLDLMVRVAEAVGEDVAQLLRTQPAPVRKSRQRRAAQVR